MRTVASPETDAPPAEEAPAPRRTLVLVAVAGFVIGSGLVGILWGAAGSTTGAIYDAKAACATLDRIGTLPDGTAELNHQTTLLPPGLVHQVTAARELAAAAAEANPAYQELAGNIDAVSRMVISLHFSDPYGHQHLAQAKQICARL